MRIKIEISNYNHVIGRFDIEADEELIAAAVAKLGVITPFSKKPQTVKKARRTEKGGK